MGPNGVPLPNKNMYRLACGHMVRFVLAKPKTGDPATCPKCKQRTKIKKRES